MAAGQLSDFLQHLRTAALLDEELTDGQLLGRFVEHQDQAALAALIRKHAPLVWGVCRRLLDEHDAEDAFQATFVVLVRRAASVKVRELVANWLYGVAYQTALKARATIAKRKKREKQVTEMPEPATRERDLWDDLRPVLDQELSRLPDKYRVVLVLCDLEGKTRKEAARQLGCPEGTVATRLRQARTLLAKRLSQLGLPLSATTLATVLSEKAASALAPPSALSSTIKAAALVAAGKTVAGLISSRVAVLSEGVIKAMLLSKTKIGMVALVVLATVGIGGGGVLYRTQMARAGQQGERNAGIEEAPGNGKQADKNENQDVEKELAKLHGTWVVIAGEVNGKALPEKTVKVLGMKLVIKGSTFVFKTGKGSSFHGTFTLDVTKNPKTVDWSLVDKGKAVSRSEGIYEPEGDTLKLCYGSKRPTAFRPKSDLREQMFVFRRAEGQQRNEKADLQGTWKVISGGWTISPTALQTQLGITGPSSGTYGDFREVVITASKLLMKRSDPSRNLVYAFKVGSPKRLTAIDLYAEQGSHLAYPLVGVYQLEQDKLKLYCFVGLERRPTDFDSKPPDVGLALVMERVTEAPDQPAGERSNEARRARPTSQEAVPPKAADQPEYVLVSRLLEAGADQPKEVLRLPKVTVEDGQLAPLHITDAPQNLLSKIVLDEKLKIGTFFDVRVRRLGENKVRLVISFQRNEVEKADVSEIRVLGNSVQTIQDVELHKPVKVVLQKDAGGSAKRWIEITVDGPAPMAVPDLRLVPDLSLPHP